MSASFVFVVCNVSSSALAKREVLERHPEARLAFSRPGLLTFKMEGASPRFGEHLVFGRVAGQSLGTAREASEVLGLASDEHRAIHVFPRNPGHAASVARAAEVRNALMPRASIERVLRDGDLVLDVVVAEGDPLFVGHHVHGPTRSLAPGGLFDVKTPPDAPSRSYAKLEEALAWSGLATKPGWTVVEVGAAPGGATLACLSRGLRVVAFDPAPLDPRVLDYVGPVGARVVFHERAAGAITRADVPRDARLLVVDVNLAPPVMLRYVARLRPMLPALRAAILTVKLNDERMVAGIPRWIERVRALGFPDVRARQLPSHRREIVIVARAR